MTVPRPPGGESLRGFWYLPGQVSGAAVSSSYISR